MAATLTVQNTAAGNGVTSASCTINGVASGNLIATLMTEKDGGTLAVPASDIDGSLTQAATRAVSARRVAIHYFKNATAGNHAMSVTWGGNRTFDFNASAWGGCETTGGADQSTSTGGAATTSHNCGAITPSASALILGCWGSNADGGTFTPGSDGASTLNINASAETGKQYYQYKAGQGASSIDLDFTTSASVARDACIAAFLETAAAAGRIHKLGLLGVS